SPLIKNCIFWEKSDGPYDPRLTIVNNTSTPSVTFPDVWHGYPGTDNINVDPKFISPNPEIGGQWGTFQDHYTVDLAIAFRLQNCSPAINAGNNANVAAKD